MKPPVFDYEAPSTLAEAVDILHRLGPDAKVVAGGQSLIPLLNFRLVRPSVIVDMGGLRELAFVQPVEGGLRIGALTTHADIEESSLVHTAYPLMKEAVEQIGHPAIRNRGTFGGSLAHGDPAAEWPAVATALDATIHCRSVRGERTHDAREFWTAPLSTLLEPDEVITEVSLPRLPPRTGTAFVEFSRRFGDFALALAAVVISLANNGTVCSARLVLGGVGPHPLRHQAAEAALIDQTPDDTALRGAAQMAATGIQPTSDLHASAEYRRELIRHLVWLALTRATARASASA